jgi:hypothetical protein
MPPSAPPRNPFLFIKSLFSMSFLPNPASLRCVPGFVALQRKTADNFRLATRAALRNLDFVRK